MRAIAVAALLLTGAGLTTWLVTSTHPNSAALHGVWRRYEAMPGETFQYQGEQGSEILLLVHGIARDGWLQIVGTYSSIADVSATGQYGVLRLELSPWGEKRALAHWHFPMPTLLLPFIDSAAASSGASWESVTPTGKVLGRLTSVGDNSVVEAELSNENGPCGHLAYVFDGRAMPATVTWEQPSSRWFEPPTRTHWKLVSAWKGDPTSAVSASADIERMLVATDGYATLVRAAYNGDADARLSDAISLIRDTLQSSHTPVVRNILEEYDAQHQDVCNDARERALRLSILIGHRLPDWEARVLAGGTWRLSQAHGRVVVLEFWRTTCGPCILQLRRMETLAQRHAASDAVFITVCTDQDDREITAARDRLRIGLPILVGPSVADHYAVDRLPTTIVLDRQGVLVFYSVGSSEGAMRDVEAAIATVIRQ